MHALKYTCMHALKQVEQFRAEAQAASAALQAAVERTHARVQGDESQLERLRAEAAQQANSEAMALGNTRAQVMELQAMLAGINQQIMSDQAVRRGDAKAMAMHSPIRLPRKSTWAHKLCCCAVLGAFPHTCLQSASSSAASLYIVHFPNAARPGRYCVRL
eukprot:1159012-Pelagomonas_calceolata.AAC.6